MEAKDKRVILNALERAKIMAITLKDLTGHMVDQDELYRSRMADIEAAEAALK